MTTLPPVPAPFQYNATVVSVHDGDTLDVIVDWGKRRYEGSQDHPQPIRLLGCNARELSMQGGPEARYNLASILLAGTPVVLITVGDDKFAPRWDCGVVYLRQGVPSDLVSDLVLTGWAAPWNGEGVKPVPLWPRPLASFAVQEERRVNLARAVTQWRAAA